jgi:hypothetical protein
MSHTHLYDTTMMEASTVLQEEPRTESMNPGTKANALKLDS